LALDGFLQFFSDSKASLLGSVLPGTGCDYLPRLVSGIDLLPGRNNISEHPPHPPGGIIKIMHYLFRKKISPFFKACIHTSECSMQKSYRSGSL